MILMSNELPVCREQLARCNIARVNMGLLVEVFLRHQKARCKLRRGKAILNARRSRYFKRDMDSGSSRGRRTELSGFE